MATLRLIINTRASPLGFIPLDAEIAAGVVDLFYLTCLGKEYHSISLDAYEAEIQYLHYSNPLEVAAFFRNIGVRTAKSILDRTIFFKEAKDARAIANDKARQELIAMRIDNATRLAQARKKILATGMDEEAVAQLLGDISHDMAVTLQIEGPQPQRGR
jgi:hypothetical protein